ncbi:MAG: AlpA family transcriptional regulator [Pseudomonadota bacterium]|nr:AlpA family transcriptional regulator [Pseudomonadota bacterium]
MRLLRLNEVKAKVGLSRSSIYRRIESKEFPRPVSLGGRSKGWIDAEVDEWIMQRIADDRGDVIPEMNY